MLLRASSENTGEVNLSALTSDDGRGSGVPHGDAIVRLVDAALGDDDDAVAAARAELTRAMGKEALVDAAAVLGTFTMQNRVADATGLPLDTPLELASRGVREELGSDRFASAAHTHTGGMASALLSRVAQKLAPSLLRLVSRARRRRADR